MLSCSLDSVISPMRGFCKLGADVNKMNTSKSKLICYTTLASLAATDSPMHVDRSLAHLYSKTGIIAET